MKNVIKFLLFVTYATCIFFLPNNKFIMLLVVLNLCIMLISKLHLKEVMTTSIHVLPFIIFTFIINYMLDNFYNALWIGVKLFIVCNITIVYSETTNVLGIAETIKTICYPLKLFKVNTDDIKVMICISLSVIPILKKDLYELKEACKAKKITLNLKNIKIVLVKFFLSLILRVNEIEESLIAKGFSNE